MAKSCSSPERVDIRIDVHVVESDVYLSRVTSALARHGFRSSHLFATVALENVLKVLVKIDLQPFSNSRFIEMAEIAKAKLGIGNLFDEYVEMTDFGGVNKAGARDRLRLFKNV